MAELITQIQDTLQRLNGLVPKIIKSNSYAEKNLLLDKEPLVQEYLSTDGIISKFIVQLNPEAAYVVKAVIAIGEGPIIFNSKHLVDQFWEPLHSLLDELLDLELFYKYMGGIIGYHCSVLKMIVERKTEQHNKLEGVNYLYPIGLHLDNEDMTVRAAIRYGIEHLEYIADLYPIGGAGDRLGWIDSKTGESLPAALLPFLGRTLLEGLIRDIQAREYLFYKLFKKQLNTPIVFMTSVEKNNHVHILNVCQNGHWFGMNKENIYFFLQPLVPVITEAGHWSLSGPLKLTSKPSGHGVIWKLAEEQGVFNWLEERKRKYCLVRQINNPLGGLDCSLLALLGIGIEQEKSFGFLSTERLLNSSEGVDVVVEKNNASNYEYCLTNIEYTELEQRGIPETPMTPNSPFSMYPANTNILFASISAIKKAIKICPIPGQLINMKSQVNFIDANGVQSHIAGGRLESTMQNIADCLTSHSIKPLTPEECQKVLPTFIVYQKRIKTISTTKNSYKNGQSLNNTPEQAYYDLLSNNHELLQNCGFQLPTWSSLDEYLKTGPSCIVLFHPGLGPLYSIIKQKIRRGRLSLKAEVQLEIAEVDIEDLVVDGSLHIQATAPLGKHTTAKLTKEGYLHYGGECRCTLRRVTIANLGMATATLTQLWKNEIVHTESVHIVLNEGAEFFATDVLLTGNHYFEVPPFHRMVIYNNTSGKLESECKSLAHPTWEWQYSFDEQHHLCLSRIEH